MRKISRGFSTLELLVVVLIMAIVIAIALPQAINSLRGYKLHSDATSLASYMNIARMRAASQYAPYRLVIHVAAGNYIMEELCGEKTSTDDSACTGTNFYTPLSSHKYFGGWQLISQGNILASCRPSFITGTLYPGTISGDLSPCPHPLYIYFNTRGSPVDNTGNPLSNGGAVIYVTNRDNLVDAVTVALGGQVSVAGWSGSAWVVR